MTIGKLVDMCVYRNWRKERSTEAREEYKKSKQNTKKGYFVSNGNETEGTCKRSK